jgi:hypothetical protein
MFPLTHMIGVSGCNSSNVMLVRCKGLPIDCNYTQVEHYFKEACISTLSITWTLTITEGYWNFTAQVHIPAYWRPAARHGCEEKLNLTRSLFSGEPVSVPSFSARLKNCVKLLFPSLCLPSFRPYAWNKSTPTVNFHEIWHLKIFRKFVDIIPVSLKSDKNNGYFTWRHMYIYVTMSLNSS